MSLTGSPVVFVHGLWLHAGSWSPWAELNRARAVSLTQDEFWYGFGNTLPRQESDELSQRWTVPSPGKPLFEAALANFTPQSPAKVNTHDKTRGPLLLIAGGRDQPWRPRSPRRPAGSTTSRQRSLTSGELADRGHSLTTDRGRREVAQQTLDWLNQRA